LFKLPEGNLAVDADLPDRRPPLEALPRFDADLVKAGLGHGEFPLGPLAAFAPAPRAKLIKAPKASGRRIHQRVGTKLSPNSRIRLLNRRLRLELNDHILDFLVP